MRESTSIFVLKLYTANNLSVQTWNDDDDALLFMLNACKKSLVYQQAALRSGILFQNPFVILRRRKLTKMISFVCESIPLFSGCLYWS